MANHGKKQEECRRVWVALLGAMFLGRCVSGQSFTPLVSNPNPQTRKNLNLIFGVSEERTGTLWARIHALKGDRSHGEGLTIGRQLFVSLWIYGGRCRIRTCDFHRVKVALYR